MRVDVVQTINDVAIAANAPDSIINLFENFDDPFTTGQVVTFQVENLDGAPNDGQIQLVLFDQPGEGAPIATERFSDLINDGSFDNLVINRGQVDFVVQAGLFGIDPATQALTLLPQIDTIQGAPSPDRSNTQGTVAFALSGGDPDSATSQFFFNLGDNSFLDPDFTVFGEVLSAADFDVVEAVSNDPVFAPFQPPNGIGFVNGPTSLNDGVDSNDLIFFSSASIAPQSELIFTATSSNPDLVVPSVEDGNLTLDLVAGQTGTAEITVEATNLLGDETATDTFSVEVDAELDLDGDGLAPSVDVLNIFRVLAGAPQAVVVPDGLSQQAIVDVVEAFDDLELDVDGSGAVESSTDILNIFRVLAGAPQAVVVPEGVSQQDVVNAVNELAI